jgi:hypothetical protein
MDSEREEITPAPRVGDLVLWSSTWLGLANAACLAAASKALGGAARADLALFAFCGTVVVYVHDHLSELERDRRTSPLRSAFLVTRQRGLHRWALLCLVVSLVLGFSFAQVSTLALAAGALCLGLLHRRWKQRPWSKPLYIALAWILVTVGLPATLLPGVSHVAWVAGVLAPTGMANVLLYNLRPGLALGGPRRSGAWAVSGLLLVGALVLALLAPAPVRGLAWLPVAMSVALWRPPQGERSVAWITDGLLLLGGLLAWLLPLP